MRRISFTIHEKVEEAFNVFSGVKDYGLVKAVAERPNTRLYTGFEPYDNIYLKVASLMEGIIRWHPSVLRQKQENSVAYCTNISRTK